MNDKSNMPSDSHGPDQRLVSHKLGVWRLVMLKADSFDILKNVRDVATAIPVFFRMASEIYALDPFLTTLYIVAQFSGLSSLLQAESTLMLYLSSKLLTSIEAGITQGFSNRESILTIVIAQLAWIIAAGSLTCNHFYPNFRRRVAAHYKIIRMKVELEKYRFLDSTVVGSQGNDEIHGAWDSFSAIISFLSQITSMCVQVILIAQTAREFGHLSFAIVQRSSLEAFPIISLEVVFDPVSTVPYLMEEIIEYAKSSARVGNIPTSFPEEQYGQRSTPFSDILSDLLGKAPMASYTAFN
ncbi:uncharacterized protein BT62DRAFT_1010437 [Guyanagaster necrorhizus]|uniref:Uncharacterized protein n=1 Tax=Guyanagaster necrorhizus TaxID=856835 RepID=A0A9P8AP16_9AGAR|nr:uncharacterized protein BT62DRAFT_1010437 [Guyanagaster necrorhizus MCA 3950]KAG7442474.1 hypothetical protein BT62DRAFT_1010437 [Guyanagaster necrorhizus MCA 3950]